MPAGPRDDDTSAPVTVLKAVAAESQASPEMRYLLSHVLLEAQRTFGAARLVPVDRPGDRGDGSAVDDGPAGAPGDVDAQAAARSGYTLLLGPDDLLTTNASLAALRAAVDAGADAAVPTALADAGTDAPVYTLRGFERTERRFLDGALAPAAPAAGPGDLMPMALVRPGALERVLGGRSPAELLHSVRAPGAGGRQQPEGAGSELEIVRTGLYHRFIDYYGEVRSDVLPFLPDDAGEVLEIGCGRGETGAFLQRETGCRVTGVELNPRVARAAAERLHRVVVGDVEDADTLAALDGGYDALLALELFEHLVDQERFLEVARSLVRPGGRIVMSVPNVGHWSVVEDLLAGRWDYLPIGLLCYTHYRFFTRRTLADWLARCGFAEARLVPQHTEPPPWLPQGDAAAVGADRLGDLEIDAESLRTKGFYVLLDLPGESDRPATSPWEGSDAPDPGGVE